MDAWWGQRQLPVATGATPTTSCASTTKATLVATTPRASAFSTANAAYTATPTATSSAAATATPFTPTTDARIGRRILSRRERRTFLARFCENLPEYHSRMLRRVRSRCHVHVLFVRHPEQLA